MHKIRKKKSPKKTPISNSQSISQTIPSPTALRSGTPQPGRKGQVPREASPTVQVLGIEPPTAEPPPGGMGIDQGQIAVQDASPSALGLIDAAVVEQGLPLLGHKGAAARVRARGKDGQHVDAVDVFGPGPEVGRVVDLVFEQDARDLVPDEPGRLVGITPLEQEVVAQRAPEHGHHEVAARFHGGVVAGPTPHFDRVG